MSDYRYEKIDPKDRFDMKYKNEGMFIRLMPLWFIPLIAAIILALLVLDIYIIFFGGSSMLTDMLSILIIIILNMALLTVLNLLLDGKRYRCDIEENYMRIFNGSKLYVFQYSMFVESQSRNIDILKKHLIAVTIECQPLGRKKFIYVFPDGSIDRSFENTPFGIVRQKAHELRQSAVNEQHGESRDTAAPREETVFFSTADVPTQTVPRFSENERYAPLEKNSVGTVHLYVTYYNILKYIVLGLMSAVDITAAVFFIFNFGDVPIMTAAVLTTLALSVFAAAALKFIKNGQQWQYNIEYDKMRIYRKNVSHLIRFGDVISYYHNEVQKRNKPYGAKCTLKLAEQGETKTMELVCVYSLKRSEQNYQSTPFYVFEKALKAYYSSSPQA